MFEEFTEDYFMDQARALGEEYGVPTQLRFYRKGERKGVPNKKCYGKAKIFGSRRLTSQKSVV